MHTLWACLQAVLSMPSVCYDRWWAEYSVCTQVWRITYHNPSCAGVARAAVQTLTYSLVWSIGHRLSRWLSEPNSLYPFSFRATVTYLVPKMLQYRAVPNWEATWLDFHSVAPANDFDHSPLKYWQHLNLSLVRRTCNKTDWPKQT